MLIQRSIKMIQLKITFILISPQQLQWLTKLQILIYSNVSRLTIMTISVNVNIISQILLVTHYIIDQSAIFISILIVTYMDTSLVTRSLRL